MQVAEQINAQQQCAPSPCKETFAEMMTHCVTLEEFREHLQSVVDQFYHHSR